MIGNVRNAVAAVEGAELERADAGIEDVVDYDRCGSRAEAVEGALAVGDRAVDAGDAHSAAQRLENIVLDSRVHISAEYHGRGAVAAERCDAIGKKPH